MTNYEYYGTREDAEKAFRELHKDKPIVNFDKRFICWLYDEHDRKTIKETSEVLISEVMKYGFSNDTMASDRLYDFIEALKNGTNDEPLIATKLEELDDNGARRKIAMTLALLVIGEKFAKDMNINEIIENFAHIDNIKSSKYSDSSTTGEKTCVAGKTTCVNCPFCKNGYCTFTFLCSYPPQYQKCDFNYSCGPMYKFCSEVQKNL